MVVVLINLISILDFSYSYPLWIFDVRYIIFSLFAFFLANLLFKKQLTYQYKFLCKRNHNVATVLANENFYTKTS